MECVLQLSDEHTTVTKIKDCDGIWKISNVTTYPYYINGYSVTLFKYTFDKLIHSS